MIPRFVRALACLLAFCVAASAAGKKLVIVAGKPSHPPGMHEFRAGSLLLQKCLEGVNGLTTVVYTNGWPNVPDAFDGADAVLFYMDGGPGHAAIQEDRLKTVKALSERGVGIACAHYAVEVPKGEAGDAWLQIIGGYYEDRYSCNPLWEPEYKSFVEHPITRGVKPFTIKDEWYMNIRFAPDQKGVTPILVSKPSDKVRGGPYVWPAGPYKHVQENSGRDETMMWAHVRDNGARGFGFTGGHLHTNWGDENFRKVMLNALLWLAKMDVPAGGVESKLDPSDLSANLDSKGPKK